MTFDSHSFASADTIPSKIIINQPLIESCRKNKKIIPIHLQLNPTNKCTLSCSFCSCKNRNRTLELDFSKLQRFLLSFKRLGGQSVTITGGGEPLLYPRIAELIDNIISLNIKVGVVTNGTAWDNLFNHWNGYNATRFDQVTWVRISASDELNVQLHKIGITFTDWLNNIKQISQNYPTIDWAFSYVLSPIPNLTQITQLIIFANTHNFTHIRIVSDILHSEEISPVIQKLKENLSQKLSLSKVNFQPRNNPSYGQEKCLISLAKPVLGADGYLYPCCGTQYALPNPAYDYEQTMRLGQMENLEEIIQNQKHFNGLVCVRCHYKAYNDILDIILTSQTIKHQEFI